MDMRKYAKKIRWEAAAMKMKKIVAFLVCLILAMSALGAFAEGDSATALNVAIGSQFTTLDPAMNTETVNAYVLQHIYAGMFVKDSDNNVVNLLCDTYEVSEDGLTYTFHMVEDAVWSDGVPVTAHDFEYAYLRALSYGPDNAYGVNNMVTYIAGAAEYNQRAMEAGESFDCTVEDHSDVGVAALDDYTLQLTLSTPCAYLTGLMCTNCWLPVREDFAVQHDSMWAYESGYPTCGAYTLVECNENEGATLQKSETFINADSVTLDTINFIVMTDPASQTYAFQTGEVDVAMSPGTESASMYSGTENLWIMPQSSNYFLAINSGETGPEWAKDANVRRALALAIDKDALVEVLGGTDFYRVLNGYVPRGLSGISGDFREEGDADGYTLTYDPEQAMQLLAEAGYDESNPLQITYKYSNNGIHADVATMLQSMWQAIGVDVTFDAVEAGVFYDQCDQGQFEICRYGYVTSNDAMEFLDIWTSSHQVTAAVDDPTYDEMVAEAKMIVDRTEYYTAVHAVEDYLCDENVYVIPLFDYTSPVLMQSGISGYRSLGGTPDFSQVVFAE